MLKQSTDFINILNRSNQEPTADQIIGLLCAIVDETRFETRPDNPEALFEMLLSLKPLVESLDRFILDRRGLFEDPQRYGALKAAILSAMERACSQNTEIAQRIEADRLAFLEFEKEHSILKEQALQLDEKLSELKEENRELSALNAQRKDALLELNDSKARLQEEIATAEEEMRQAEAILGKLKEDAEPTKITAKFERLKEVISNFFTKPTIRNTKELYQRLQTHQQRLEDLQRQITEFVKDTADLIHTAEDLHVNRSEDSDKGGS